MTGVARGDAVTSISGPLEAGKGVAVASTTALPLACGKGVAAAIGDAVGGTALAEGDGDGDGDGELLLFGWEVEQPAIKAPATANTAIRRSKNRINIQRFSVARVEPRARWTLRRFAQR